MLGRRQRNQPPSKTCLSANAPWNVLCESFGARPLAREAPRSGRGPEPVPVQLGGQSRLPRQDPGGTEKRRPGAGITALLCPGNGWAPAWLGARPEPPLPPGQNTSPQIL